MAKKFVRSITGIKNIKDQDLSTNNVGDLLSDGKDIYVHRKNGTKEEYFNLTEEKKNPTTIATPEGKGLTSWKEGDTTKVSLSEEFLTNNAQYISSSDNSIVATPTQSKYGKNYDLKLSEELQNTIKNNTGKGGKTIKITNEWSKNNMTAKETDDAVTLGLTENVLTVDNFCRGSISGSGASVTLEAGTIQEPSDDGLHDYTRNVWDLKLHENYWLTRRNLQTVEGSGILYKDKSDVQSQFSTLDIDSTKLVRHDCLLGDEAKGIKVWHTPNQSTSSISLTDDVWAKLAKVDQLTSGEPVTPTTVSNTDGNITVTTQNNNAEVNFSDGAKAKLAKIDTLDTEVTNLKQTIVKPTVSITSPKGTITVTPSENAYQLDVADNALAYQGDNETIEISQDMDNNNIISLKSNLKDKIDTVDGLQPQIDGLEERTGTLETTVKKLSAGSTATKPEEYYSDNDFLDSDTQRNGLTGSILGIPHGDGTGVYKYFATITLEADVSKSQTYTIPADYQFAKWLAFKPALKSGVTKSGALLLTKGTDGSITVNIAPNEATGAKICVGTFTVDLEEQQMKHP